MLFFVLSLALAGCVGAERHRELERAHQALAAQHRELERQHVEQRRIIHTQQLELQALRGRVSAPERPGN